MDGFLGGERVLGAEKKKPVCKKIKLDIFAGYGGSAVDGIGAFEDFKAFPLEPERFGVQGF
ncbi:unnamed protein product [marine sediment metagenome]|uniref:Uncharacterized protein n=1 Tax=marine sediment metagenome TaxID=412755 RepID=X1KDS6_9ZZZZ